MASTVIQTLKNGPYLVNGEIELKDAVQLRPASLRGYGLVEVQVPRMLPDRIGA